MAQTSLGTETAKETPWRAVFGRVTQQVTPGEARDPAAAPAWSPAAMGYMESSVFLPEGLTLCNTL